MASCGGIFPEARTPKEKSMSNQLLVIILVLLIPLSTTVLLVSLLCVSTRLSPSSPTHKEQSRPTGTLYTSMNLAQSKCSRQRHVGLLTAMGPHGSLSRPSRSL